MPRPGTNAQAEIPGNTLPLFRPEALAARDRSLGEVLRIRPFSLKLLLWLGIAIAAVVLGFLIASHFAQKSRVPRALLGRIVRTHEGKCICRC